MNRRFAIILHSIVIATALCMVACSDGSDHSSDPIPDLAVSTHETISIDWADDWDAAFVAARSAEKPVMAVFYADWCIWCKRLDNTTLANTDVAAFISDQVVPVKLDIDHDGKSLSQQHRVQGPPTIIVFSTDGTEIGRIPGYLPPAGFLQRVRMLL